MLKHLDYYDSYICHKLRQERTTAWNILILIYEIKKFIFSCNLPTLYTLLAYLHCAKQVSLGPSPYLHVSLIKSGWVLLYYNIYFRFSTQSHMCSTLEKMVVAFFLLSFNSYTFCHGRVPLFAGKATDTEN